MKRETLAVLWMIVALGVSTPLNATDDSSSLRYLIQFQVVVTDEEQISITSRQMELDRVVASATEVSTITIGDLTLDLDDDHLWGGQPIPSEGSGIKVLSKPRVSIPPGGAAKMRSGGPSEIQYLELQGEDCYSVSTLLPDFTPGLIIEVAAQEGRPDDQPGTVYLDIKTQVTILGGREPVPGLNLDVGKPTVQFFELNTHKRFRLDRWNLMTSQVSRDLTNLDAETLLVFFRASRQ